MAITPALYELAYHPQTLQFIQFYVDTPHMYPSGRYNPISGSIVTAGWKSFQIECALELLFYGKTLCIAFLMDGNFVKYERMRYLS
ncbi:uncharacterized protein LOC130013983, partial [Patella vulgata]|uniref:uncharacterized protein LOC130013983 n=1 Tax=Patella vulgata TaxID=6465 RepID=UPI00217F92BA